MKNLHSQENLKHKKQRVMDSDDEDLNLDIEGEDLI